MVDDDRRTRALSDLLADFAAVAKGVREVGAGGKVTLTIKVDKDKNDEEALSISYDVNSSIPKVKRKASIGFFDEKHQDRHQDRPAPARNDGREGRRAASQARTRSPALRAGHRQDRPRRDRNRLRSGARWFKPP
jgi:hypothetical protein